MREVDDWFEEFVNKSAKITKSVSQLNPEKYDSLYCYEKIDLAKIKQF